MVQSRETHRFVMPGWTSQLNETKHNKSMFYNTQPKLQIYVIVRTRIARNIILHDFFFVTLLILRTERFID